MNLGCIWDDFLWLNQPPIFYSDIYAADNSQQIDAYELVYVGKLTSVSEDWYMDDKCVLDHLII